MKKRWIAVLLLAAMILTLLPFTPAEAAQSTETDLETLIYQQVDQAVEKYAASVWQDNSSVDAFFDFGLFATFSNAPEMTVTKDSAIISTAWNSCLLRDSVKNALTGAIVMSQDLNIDEMYLSGETGWHSFYDNYSVTAFASTERDYDKRIGTVASTKSIYGTYAYTGEQNVNDKMMQLLAGGLRVRTLLRRVEVTADEAVYEAQITLGDNWDFESSYSGVEKQGYDTTVDKILGLFGKALTKLFLNNFTWEFTDTLEIRVPYSCDHQTNTYRWEYDSETEQLVNIIDGYTANGTTRYEYTSTTTGAVTPYFKLDDPVVLEHDEPWVVEYETKKSSSIMLSPMESSSYSLPLIYQSGRSYIWIRDYDYKLLYDYEEYPNVPSTDRYTYTYHYMGADLREAFKYSSKYTYTYRLENRVAEDGTNMIWVSVYNSDLDRLETEPMPLDDYWTQKRGETTRTLQSEESDMIVGQDVTINYVGNKSARITCDVLNLTIWEGGENAEDQSTMITYYRAPSCTEDGGNVHACTHCGYTYLTEIEPAFGHSFGTYTSDHNAACEKDGTMSATCSTCGAKNSVTEPGTALGHAIGVLAAKEPTCTEYGLTEGSYCTRCSKVLEAQQVISAPGHTWQAATCKTLKTCTACGKTTGKYADHRAVIVPGVAPTCSTAGWTEGKVCGDCGIILEARKSIAPTWEHNFNEADCENAKHCADCSAVRGMPLGHQEEVLTGYAATCTEAGLSDGVICTLCNRVIEEQQILEALGHDWQEADCENAKTCLACGLTEGEAHDHTPVSISGTAATCTATGLSDGTVCGDCGKQIEPQTVISAVDHTWQEADCEAAKTCTACGLTEGDPLGHTEQTVLGTAATCTATGLTDGIQCQTCGKVLTAQEEIPATGHAWQAATCIAPEICAECSATQGDPAGHDVVAQAAVEPTCAKTGLTGGSYCAVCDEVLVEQQIVAKTDEHTDDDGNGRCDICSAALVAEVEGDPEDSVEEEPAEEGSEEAAEQPKSQTQQAAAEPDEAPADETAEEAEPETGMLMSAAPDADAAANELPAEDVQPEELPANDLTMDAGAESGEPGNGGLITVLIVVIAVCLAACVAILVIRKRKQKAS